MTATAPAGRDPLYRLEQARLELGELEERIRYLVRVARDPHHLYGDGRQHSWAAIGEALGTTRQAAHERYGPAPAGPAPCHFQSRPGCAGPATHRRGRVPLCDPCESRASTLTRSPRRPL